MLTAGSRRSSGRVLNIVGPATANAAIGGGATSKGGEGKGRERRGRKGKGGTG